MFMHSPYNFHYVTIVYVQAADQEGNLTLRHWKTTLVDAQHEKNQMSPTVTKYENAK